MRFGLHLPNSGALTAEVDLVAMAVHAEEIGFDAVWVYDHVFNPVELSEATRRTRPEYYNHADMPYYDALTTLSVIAGATSLIGLGTRVLLPVLRHPVPLAKQIGTLAVLAGPDRLILGVGAGWLIEEFDAVDIDPDERFARLDEHVAVISRILNDGIAEHSGRFYHHPPAGFHPVPDNAVPILVGGSGPAAIRRVARWGDGWAMPNVEPGPNAEAEVASLLNRLTDACQTEGRDPAEVRLVAGAPLSAEVGHFEMLSAAGVHDVDLMLTLPSELSLSTAETFMREVAPAFA
jgi:probable F420-dependent oxidoreductase